MSDFAFFSFLAACLCGVLAAFFLGQEFGSLGCAAGALLGTGFGLTLIWIASRLLRLLPKHPSLPVCMKGLCSREDYRFEVHEGRGLYVCRCGDKYLLDANHRRFEQLSPEGTPRPYMVRRGLLGMGAWQRELGDSS